MQQSALGAALEHSGQRNFNAEETRGKQPWSPQANMMQMHYKHVGSKSLHTSTNMSKMQYKHVESRTGALRLA
jgi:hypothetical protein